MLFLLNVQTFQLYGRTKNFLHIHFHWQNRLILFFSVSSLVRCSFNHEYDTSIQGRAQTELGTEIQQYFLHWQKVNTGVNIAIVRHQMANGTGSVYYAPSLHLDQDHDNIIVPEMLTLSPLPPPPMNKYWFRPYLEKVLCPDKNELCKVSSIHIYTAWRYTVQSVWVVQTNKTTGNVMLQNTWHGPIPSMKKKYKRV